MFWPKAGRPSFLAESLQAVLAGNISVITEHNRSKLFPLEFR
jgi:hypothetical protein